MTKKKIYVWACDYSKSTGEGNLGRLFVNTELKKIYQINICQYKPRNFLTKFLFNYKYIIPFKGILNCWKYFLIGEKTCYLNYLPFWNFFLFILLPPNTILGPITGGSNYRKAFSLNYFIRRFVFPIFYKISCIILSFRNSKIFFSTSLLKKYLSSNLKNKSSFNFVLRALMFKKRTLKKNADFVIYYRHHKNKLTFYPIKFIKSLLSYRYNVYIVGDKLNIEGVKNLGFLNRTKLEKILSKCKFSISSGENLLSFFFIECLSYKIKILTNNKIPNLNASIKKKLIYFNPNKNYNKFQIKILLKK